MEFIAGSSLAGLQQVLTREEKVRAIQQIAEALHAAHSQGLIHRDLKPANMMAVRREDGTYWPFLMDFGLAREVDGSTQTSTAGIEGTPAYMAPEQARGETRLLGPRTDVYGMGATLYTILCGRPPFIGSQTDVLIEAMLNDPPPPRTFDPAIPKDLETIVLKCLEKDPQRRYESAKALAEDLDHFLQGTRIVAQPPSLVRRFGKLARRHRMLVVSVSTALIATLLLGGVALRARLQAARQARLAQELGQEIRDMEWLLRCARQMPLHDLGKEKAIIRRRMAQLQTRLGSYGSVGRGLAHYALGRGHMALHEYPESLKELWLSIQEGHDNAEVQYALGFVLGKHFEQAMYEARLSGGGEWAQKQLFAIEPQFLTPAIAALQRSRALKLDAPEYLEALISFYKRDYDAALQHAAKVLEEAPWMYEAFKLAGDIHHERALQARDSGKATEAKTEFDAAVKNYQEAAKIGQSDGEVYEGLAESWVRQVEMAARSGQPTEAAYAAALEASSKLMTVEPRNVAGFLKKAYAALLTMAVSNSGHSTSERVETCLAAANAVLEKDPENPYAGDVAAGCYAMSAEVALASGENPDPLLRKALALLEPAVRRAPRFLWGQNDLGLLYLALGANVALHGDPSARQFLENALRCFSAAIELDATYALAWANQLSNYGVIIKLSKSVSEIQQNNIKVADLYKRCRQANSQYPQCYVNPIIFYAQAALRIFLGGGDPQPYLASAKEKVAELRRLGGSFLDAEQHQVLTYYVDASDRVRRREDPMPALVELHAALSRCFAQAEKDAMCRTLAAKEEWVRADWLALRGQPFLPALQAALDKAVLATQSPEVYPDAWQALAESHLRLARASLADSSPDSLASAEVRDRHINNGLAATQRIFDINPNHGYGWATQGALWLLSAQVRKDSAARRSAALSAMTALQQALHSDELLTFGYAPLLAQAKVLTATR